MRKNSVQCDACCKAHSVEDEYDVEHLPQGWYTVIPGQGGGFKETMHFCSAACLKDWVEKQLPATSLTYRVDVPANTTVEIAHDVYLDPDICVVSQEAIEHTEDCLRSLGISINLLDLKGICNGPAVLMEQMMIAETVRDDYKKLSETILALRKDD
jgi:hypothetical protein